MERRSLIDHNLFHREDEQIPAENKVLMSFDNVSPISFLYDCKLNSVAFMKQSVMSMTHK